MGKVLLIIGIVVIAIFLTGAIIGIDVYKLKNDFTEKPKYFVLALEKEGKNLPVYAFSLQELKFDLEDFKEITLISPHTSPQEFEALSLEISKNKVKDKLVLIFNEDFFEPIDEVPVSAGGAQSILINKSIIFEAIQDPKPLEVFAERYNLDVGAIEDYLKEQQLTVDYAKAVLFLALVKNIYEEKDAIYFITSFKKGTLEVKPGYITLSLVKKFPTSWIKKILSSFVEKAKTGATIFADEVKERYNMRQQD